MHLVKIAGPQGRPRWALRDDRGDRLLDASFSLGKSLGAGVAAFRAALEPARERAPQPPAALLAPLDRWTELWAAGVTYERSRSARMGESRAPDIYDRVYEAERPELFFKSLGWRVGGDRSAISVRQDSTWDVPEPELAIVVAASGEIVGYSVGNDVSSRSIEGENPLYLPQAKSYLGGAALGPGIRPAWEVADPYALAIRLVIRRAGAVLWAGEAGTGLLRRRLDELAGYLFRADEHPGGVVLATGTCLVPGDDVTLCPGDEVEIEIGEIGTLVNPVVSSADPVLRGRWSSLP
ncbi:MAG: fumarylacetoacetate hydrolase family protein [Carbonactinosporaceae bacterium]